MASLRSEARSAVSSWETAADGRWRTRRWPQARRGAGRRPRARLSRRRGAPRETRTRGRAARTPSASSSHLREAVQGSEGPLRLVHLAEPRPSTAVGGYIEGHEPVPGRHDDLEGAVAVTDRDRLPVHLRAHDAAVVRPLGPPGAAEEDPTVRLAQLRHEQAVARAIARALPEAGRLDQGDAVPPAEGRGEAGRVEGGLGAEATLVQGASRARATASARGAAGGLGARERRQAVSRAGDPSARSARPRLAGGEE